MLERYVKWVYKRHWVLRISPSPENYPVPFFSSRQIPVTNVIERLMINSPTIQISTGVVWRHVALKSLWKSPTVWKLEVCDKTRGTEKRNRDRHVSEKDQSDQRNRKLLGFSGRLPHKLWDREERSSSFVGCSTIDKKGYHPKPFPFFLLLLKVTVLKQFK